MSRVKSTSDCGLQTLHGEQLWYIYEYARTNIQLRIIYIYGIRYTYAWTVKIRAGAHVNIYSRAIENKRKSYISLRSRDAVAYITRGRRAAERFIFQVWITRRIPWQRGAATDVQRFHVYVKHYSVRGGGGRVVVRGPRGVQ